MENSKKKKKGNKKAGVGGEREREKAPASPGNMTMKEQILHNSPPLSTSYTSVISISRKEATGNIPEEPRIQISLAIQSAST